VKTRRVTNHFLDVEVVFVLIIIIIIIIIIVIITIAIIIITIREIFAYKDQIGISANAAREFDNYLAKAKLGAKLKGIITQV
jgi:hypothetical protein